jgi:predicted TIM-barrel fold metal-dependent hydrolase
MSYPVISADSHITEAPNTYTDFIDAKYKDTAPYLIEGQEGVPFMVRDMGLMKIGPASAAGIPAPDRRKTMLTLNDMHRGGFDSAYRLAAQDRDGIAAEVVYPTLGMLLCSHPDINYKEACFKAYNRWLVEYCSVDPERILGAGQTAMRTPEDGIKDLAEIKAQGHRGVMMPGMPGLEDYDSRIYDDFWEAAAESGLVVAFHILTVGGLEIPTRGPKINLFMNTSRAVQDVIGMMIFGGVFERHPKLKMVCVEGDAGWVPHYAHRIDRGYMEQRHNLPSDDLAQMPSEYLLDRIYFTFQDDPIAFRFADAMNYKRLMWANDYPHSDSTWPHSKSYLDRHTKFTTPEQTQAILCGNVAELYGIDVASLQRKLAA